MKRKLTLLFVSIILTTLSAQAVAPVAKDTAVWVGSTSSSKWNLIDGNWMLQSFPLPLPMPATDSIAHIFQDLGPFGEIPIKTLQVEGKLRPAMIWFKNDTTNFTINKVATDSLLGSGYVLKQGRGNVTLDVANALTGGTEIREGKIIMKATTSPNVFGAKIILRGGTANLATSSASTYPTVNVPVEIPSGYTGRIELSRYSYWTSPLAGNGDLTIAAGGERTMLASNKNGGLSVDWSKYTGNVSIEPFKLTGVTPGYYALLLSSSKTYDLTSLATVDSTFANRKLTLKAGVGLSSCAGVRCFAIGELNAEDETAFIGGYGAGNSNSPKIFYMIGGKNTDVTCPVTFKDCGTSGYNWTGIIKTGTGTYTFTSTKSITTASMGVQVAQGGFYINTPITDGITSLGRVRTGVALTINARAFGGGNGRITGKLQVDSLGTLKVGYKDNIGLIALNDTLGGKTTLSPLLVKKGGTVEFKLSSATDYDKIITNSTATLNGSKLVVKPMPNYQIKTGDKFTLISARTVVLVDTFEVVSNFPSNISFTAARDTVGGGYRIVLTAKNSNDPSGIQEHKSSVKVYPNPAHNFVQIALANDVIKSVTLISINGAAIKSASNLGEQGTLDIKGVAPGIYTLTIEGKKATSHHKVVVK